MGNVAVDILLALGVAAELTCCIGICVMRSVYDRLHYAAAASTVGPVLIVAAVLIRVHLSSAGLEAIAAVAVLFLANPLLVTATAGAVHASDRARGVSPEREEPS